jgi:hypothetical protein
MVSRKVSLTFITSSRSNDVLGLEIYGERREGKMVENHNKNTWTCKIKGVVKTL